MLTNAAAKAAGAQNRAYKLTDAGGLHLLIRPTGSKSWQLKYRWRGREKLLTIGRFPDVSLAEARLKREAAKEQLRNGVDPAGKVDIQVNTLERVARAWYRHNLASWSPAHAADVLASLERDIFPAIGSEIIGSIEPPALLKALRLVEQRGRIETARRLRQRLSDIFRYAIAEGLAEKDPAATLGAAMLEAKPPRPQPALTQIESCRELLAACEQVGGREATRLASRFLALTAVRLDAVRGMRWDEVEDLGGRDPIWRVPPARMKLKKAKKDEARFAHIVPLSRQAVAVLRAAAEIGYDTHSRGGLVSPGQESTRPNAALLPGFPPADDGLVFPGRDRGRPVSEGAIGNLYDRAGFSGRHVPHGWRSSFSTILNEQLGESWSTTIDRALAHSPKDKVEAAYNRAELLDRRREIFERWGEMLDT